MKPRETTDADLAYWVDYEPVATIIGGPPSEPDCTPCPALMTSDATGRLVVRVPFELDEIEVAHLARGGTIWLSTWGGLPIHMMEVQEPPPPLGDTRAGMANPICTPTFGQDPDDHSTHAHIEGAPA